MELNKNTCAVLLVLVALAILAFTHCFISMDKFSVSTPVLSFELTSPNNLFLPSVSMAALLGLLIAHVVVHRHDIVREYREGYRRTPQLVEAARALVVEASKGSHREPAVGNIHATLRRASWDLGQWSRPDGSMSQRMEFTPDPSTHRHAVMRGIAHALRPKMWLPVYAPVLLGLWALASMLDTS